MTISAHHIRVSRTARFFTLGARGEATKEVWLLLHGYAQLAKDFLGEFTALDNGSRFLVAPEGLSRFYAKGFGGRPAASWMTSEDRENEIDDYIAYLDALYAQLGLQANNIKVIVLGFSQGVATASRWIAATRHRVDHFIICSGEIAAELQQPGSDMLKQIPLTYITGKSDPLISPEKHEQYRRLMDRLGAHTIGFEGGHEISPAALLSAAASL